MTKKSYLDVMSVALNESAALRHDGLVTGSLPNCAPSSGALGSFDLRLSRPLSRTWVPI